MILPFGNQDARQVIGVVFFDHWEMTTLKIPFRILVGAVLLSLGWTQCYGVTAGDLRYYATRHSMGIEWAVSNDANHNAECQVQYRQTGATLWQEALPLLFK